MRLLRSMMVTVDKIEAVVVEAVDAGSGLASVESPRRQI
jgi:hypothetical protein